MSFYLTLPCTASRGQYPDNTSSHYHTALARAIDLDGSWEVGLTEVMFPATKFYIEEGNRFRVWRNSQDLNEEPEYEYGIVHLNPYFMQGVAQFVESLNKVSRGFFTLTRFDKFYKLTVKSGFTVKFKGPDFSRWLGIQEGKEYLDQDHLLPLSPGFSCICLYCDLIEHIHVGDVMAPCLRVIPLNQIDRLITVERFENPHYVPLLKNTFSTVEIEFCSDLGNQVSFDPGMTLVKLHFRPKKH